MQTLIQDLRYGLRMLAKNPGFTAVAVTTLALGIGANTAIFSVVNAVLLRPLPYKHPSRLVALWETYPGIPKLQAAVADFLDWRKQNRVFEQIGAYTCRGCWEGSHAILTGAGGPEEVEATLTSVDLFPLLGVKPVLGRGFLPAEDYPGQGPVVLLSYGLWQDRFESNLGVVGGAISLSGKDYTIVGVMPRGFKFPAWADVWVPLGLVNPTEFTNRKHHLLDVIARLKPGVAPRQAQTELETIARRLGQEYPATNQSVGVELMTLEEETVGNLRLALLVLQGTVALVLLIACSNVANLFLARATTRAREIAIRSALGASRACVIRQLLAESVLLAVIGGSLGLLIAFWGLGLLRAISPNNILRHEAINLDGRVLIFTLFVSVLTGIVFGLAPALQASRTDLSKSLKEGGERSPAGTGRRLRGFLIVSEVALSLAVLTGAGLLVRSFRQLLKVNLGFNPEHLLTMQIALPDSKYSRSGQTAVFFKQLLPRIDALPGVRLAATTNVLPLTSDLLRTRFLVEGTPAPEPGKYSVCQTRSVSLDYFHVMQIPLIKGRFFTEADFGKPLIIINETMARRFFPRQDPVGKQIIMGVLDPNPAKIPIVGVVADSRNIHPYADAEPEIYWPSADSPDYLVVRTISDPLELGSAVRSAVLAVDKDQPVYEVRTMDDILTGSLSSRRFSMLLLTIFSALALVLAAVGIYSVMSYTVTERTREIAIRMAVGAERKDVLRLVMGQGLVFLLTGIGFGIAASLALAHRMSSMLFEVRPTDPATLVSVSLALAGAALLATWIPARRATKVDPMGALRYE